MENRKREAITRILLKSITHPFTVIIDDQGVKVFRPVIGLNGEYLISYQSWEELNKPEVFQHIFKLITNWYDPSNRGRYLL